MEKFDLDKYIKQLKEIEDTLNSNSLDSEFTNDLNNMLNLLNNDIGVQLDVKIKKLHKDAVVPTYAKDGDAGLDLVATEIIDNTSSQVTYGTGLAMEIPYGHVGLLFPRSSIKNHELELSNSVGVADSGYRGEIRAVFNKTNGPDSMKYKVGDRVVQLIILPYPKINFVLSDELSDSERGTGGYGSTGS
jgi:dUTP pyrophosphatase